MTDDEREALTGAYSLLLDAGCRIILTDEGTLRLRGGTITDELKDPLRPHKAALLADIRRRAEWHEPSLIGFGVLLPALELLKDAAHAYEASLCAARWIDQAPPETDPLALNWVRGYGECALAMGACWGV